MAASSYALQYLATNQRDYLEKRWSSAGMLALLILEEFVKKPYNRKKSIPGKRMKPQNRLRDNRNPPISPSEPEQDSSELQPRSSTSRRQSVN
jgi:hypothetical protein